MNDLPKDLAHPRHDDAAAIAGIVVGAVLLAILVALIVWGVTL